MKNNKLPWEERMDATIRFFLYFLIFWIPYGSSMIEGSVIFCLLLYIIKRILIVHQNQPKQASLFSKVINYLSALKPKSSPLNGPIFLFLSLCFLSVLASTFRGMSFENFLTKTVEWFVVFFLFLEVFTKKEHFKIACWVLLGTSLAVALDSFLQYYITYKDIFMGREILPGGRATASFKSANGLGGYLVVVLPICLSLLYIHQKKFPRNALLTIALLIFTWSLVITYSRGAWLAYGCGLCFFIFVLFCLQSKGKFDKSKLLVVICVVLVLCSLVYVGQTMLNRTTGDWRIQVWQDSFKMLKDRPLIGHGINTYMPLFQVYRQDTGTNPTYAHNCYVQLLTEVGFLGFSAFIWIIFRLFHISFKTYKKLVAHEEWLMLLSLGFLTGIFGFLVHSFFDIHFYSLQLSVVWWVMIGLQIAMINMSQNLKS